MRLPPRRHDAVMDMLATGLEKARGGEVPAVLIGNIGDEHKAYADWLRVMTAYEQARFHENTETAREVAENIGIDWWRQWALKEVGKRE
jgi:hypothetical protein